MPPKDQPNALVQGTLDMLILKTLALEPMHGWGISQRIQERSRDAFQVGQGSLYPALHRLEQKRWLSSEWGLTDKNRRAKDYRITAKGRKQLAVETSRWSRYTEAVARILAAEPAR